MNIYVGNLSRQATEVGVRDLFAPFGDVKSVKIVKDHETGEPRGFAFVEMSNDTSGRDAIAALDSKEFENRTLKINEARPKNTGGSRFNSFSSNYGYKDRFKTH
jgi:RNA recognition motif-containing protein